MGGKFSHTNLGLNYEAKGSDSKASISTNELDYLFQMTRQKERNLRREQRALYATCREAEELRRTIERVDRLESVLREEREDKERLAEETLAAQKDNLGDWETEFKARLPILYRMWKNSEDRQRTKELLKQVKQDIRLLWICQAHLHLRNVKNISKSCSLTQTNAAVKETNRETQKTKDRCNFRAPIKFRRKTMVFRKFVETEL